MHCWSELKGNGEERENCGCVYHTGLFRSRWVWSKHATGHSLNQAELEEAEVEEQHNKTARSDGTTLTG